MKYESPEILLLTMSEGDILTASTTIFEVEDDEILL